MKSPNDITARFYDIKTEVAPEITDSEIGLINTFVEKPAKILDVGCGTGRHLGVLSNLGYNLVGIDNSIEHLKICIKKYPKATVIESDFWKFQTKSKFDLIILMWNSFNEIVLQDDDLDRFFDKCNSLINKNGKILINFMNWEKLDLKNWNESYEIKLTDNKTISFVWQVKKFNNGKNTTTSMESIQVKDPVQKLSQDYKTEIVQRWWTKNDLNRAAKRFGYAINDNRLKVNEDHYYLFEKLRV